MVLKADGVSKTYAKSRKEPNPFRLEVDNLQVKEGSFTAILGPNGSGKTTFLKIVLDLLFADRGSVQLLGRDHKDKQARDGVSYLPEHFSFPNNFTVEEVLRSFTNLKHSTPADLDRRISTLADAFNADFLGKKIKNLSKGMTQTTALMHTFLSDDRLYILDEPFNGLDAVQKKAVMDYIFRLQDEQNISILITTHILSDIDKICDTLYLIKDGSIINSATKDEIQQQHETVEDYYLSHFDTNQPLTS